MAKRGSDIRPIIKLRSTAGTGYTYVTKKNRRNDPDRMTLRKYDPVVRRHVGLPRGTLMAKRSKVAAQARRLRTVERYAERRAALKEQIRLAEAGSQELAGAVRALSRLPRDSAAVRLRNRDQVDGRPRGYLRKAGVSRIRFREMAHRGELPGITKSSW